MMQSASPSQTEAVKRWYSQKTQDLLDKYRLGEDAILHFHLGVGAARDPRGDIRELQRQLVTSQQLLVERMFQDLDGTLPPNSTLLDVGCGLGGTSLTCAEKYGLRTTGLTLVPEHVRICQDFAKQAGLWERAQFLEKDAETMTFPHRFDAAIAIESICYMRRERVFRSVAQALAPRGFFLVADPFVPRAFLAGILGPLYAATMAQMGTLSDYDRAAESAGLRRTQTIDLTEEVTVWWNLSSAYHVKAARAGIGNRPRHLWRGLRHHVAMHLFQVGLLRYFVARYDRVNA